MEPSSTPITAMPPISEASVEAGTFLRVAVAKLFQEFNGGNRVEHLNVHSRLASLMCMPADSTTPGKVEHEGMFHDLITVLGGHVVEQTKDTDAIEYLVRGWTILFSATPSMVVATFLNEEVS